MIEQPTTPMPCPFPPCTAHLVPKRWLARSDRPGEISTTYPIHDVEGSGAWFGRCPASQLVVPQLTEAGQQVIADALRHYARQFGDRINREAEGIVVTENDEIAPVDPPPVSPANITQWLVTGSPRKLRPVDDYFPGRPADAPEPGVGEQPVKPVPLTQPGHPLGKAAEVSTREELNHLIDLVKLKVAEALDASAQVTDAMDKARAANASLAMLVDAANALSRAAVGTGADRPEPAERMAEQLFLATQTMPDLSTATALSSARAEVLGRQLLSAANAADEYRAMPK
jgi:hypothetical protein